MKLKYVLLASLMFVNANFAQSQEKGISDEVLKKLQNSYGNTSSDKAIRNAIQTNDINKLAINADNRTAFDSYFSHQVKSRAITDQKSSGRCWMFTGMNVLRAKAISV